MSHIEITHGTARVTLDSEIDRRNVGDDWVMPHYALRDLLDATAAALLAVNTPQSVEWAHSIYRITAPVKAAPR